MSRAMASGVQDAETEQAPPKMRPPKIETLNPAIYPILGQPTLYLPWNARQVTREEFSTTRDTGYLGWARLPGTF